MSDILKAAHEMATDIYEAGGMDKITFREIEALCIPQKRTFSALEIKQLRETKHLSQRVLAALLNVGPTTVQQWEMGHKKPTGSAAKLLDLLDRKGVEGLV